MQPKMRADEAAAVLGGRRRGPENLSPEFMQHARAAETITAHYKAHPSKLGRFTDAAWRARDQGSADPRRATEEG